MSNELRASFPTGATLYAVVYDRAGRPWNGAAWDSTPTDGEWASYAVPMTEDGTTGLYRGNLPAVGHGLWRYEVRKRVGGAAASTDPVVWADAEDNRPGGDDIVSVVESQRGGHTHAGHILYVDGTGGNDTTGDGSKLLPYATITRALVDCTANAHDLIILLPRSGQNPNTITEPTGVDVNKPYTLIRGPGRDVVVTRSGAGPVITISGNGVELSGMRVATAGAASNAVQVTAADFPRLHRVWIESPTQDGVNIAVGTNARIESCVITGAGRAGVRVESGAGSGYFTRVVDSTIRECAGAAVELQGVDASEAQIQRNVLRDNAIGVNVGSGVIDTVITDNRMVNNAQQLVDAGTRTLQMWNWLATDTNGNITGSVSIGGSSIWAPPQGAVLTTGSQVQTFAATVALDASYHQVSDAGGALEVYYEFNVGSDGIPATLRHTGRLNGSNDSLSVWAYNWGTLAWVQIGTLAGQAGTGDVARDYTLLSSYVGTGGNDGLVRVRFYAASGLTAATLFTDQILVGYSRVLEGVASQASVDNLLTMVDTEVASILAKVNPLPADPASQAAVEAALSTLALEASVGDVATVLSGITSLASWLRAIARKDASEPEIGGTYSPATDSLEGQVDTGGAGVTPETFWTYAGPRTLTMTARQLGQLSSPRVLYLVQGDTILLSLDGGTDLADRAALYFSVKRAASDPDSAAIIRASEADGLLLLGGAAADPTLATITVTDEGLGLVDIRIEGEAAAALAVNEAGSGGGPLECDLRALLNDGTVLTLHRSRVVVQSSITQGMVEPDPPPP